jgi:hypothetical protein
MRKCKLPPRRYSGMLRSVGRWPVTGVSELHVGPILKDQAGFFVYLSLEERTGVLSQNINNLLQTYATKGRRPTRTLLNIVQGKEFGK